MLLGMPRRSGNSQSLIQLGISFDVLNMTEKRLSVFDLVMHINGNDRSNGMGEGEVERIQTMATSEVQYVW